MLEIIKSRRSTRFYDEKEVEFELIEKVIEAGRFAPSGGNSQSCHFLVIQNKEVLNKLENMVQDSFSKMELKEGMYKSLVNSITQSHRGNYKFAYNAPILIVVCNQMGYGNNIADSACALENMMLMANHLDLGSCWINQLKWLNEDEKINEYLFSLGMEFNERAYGALALGYASKRARTPLDRVGNKVTWIK